MVEKITKESILKFISENKVQYSCTQQKLCIPIIDRMYKKMVFGIKFSEIKVEDSLICDGHHRYLASLLANYPIETIPSVTTTATTVIDWESVTFDDNEWETTEDIEIFNKIDADYNNTTIEKIIDLLK